MTTTKTSKISLNRFDDKRFYVNNIKSYLHDENLYLFKRDLIKMIYTTPIELLIKLGLDVSKESLESLINNILELTINDDRKLIEAAIRLYNNLRSGFHKIGLWRCFTICEAGSQLIILIKKQSG